MRTADTRIYVGRLDGGVPAVYAIDSRTVERLESGGEGFRWGAGSTLAALELARVLLTDTGGSDPPADACRGFARQILRRLPHDGFALQRDTVGAWLRRYVTVS